MIKKYIKPTIEIVDLSPLGCMMTGTGSPTGGQNMMGGDNEPKPIPGGGTL